MTNLFRNPDALVDAVRAIMIGETNKNDKSDDGEGLDAVQPKAVKKKFADRKDKDIDNDGDTDSSDEYLHKRRKAISKAMKEESDVDEAINHSRYMRSHGKKASGTGVWAFTTKDMGKPSENEMIIVQGSKKLSDAAKEAMKKLGSKEVYVMEDTELDEGFINLGGAKVKDDEKSILQHIKKTFPNVKKVKKDSQHGWIPVFEEVELDEARIDDVLAVALDNAANKHSPKGRDWGKLTATAAQKLIDKEMEKLGYAMTVGGKWIKEDVDEDGSEKTDAQKYDMDGDGEKDVKKKKKKKKNDDEEETSKPNKIDTDPEIKTSVSEVYEKKDSERGPSLGFGGSDDGGENLMMALRKAVSLRGQYNVAFKDGKKVKVSMNDALTLLIRLQKEKPADREALMKSAYKSEKHFKMALKGHIEKKKNPLDLD